MGVRITMRGCRRNFEEWIVVGSPDPLPSGGLHVACAFSENTFAYVALGIRNFDDFARFGPRFGAYGTLYFVNNGSRRDEFGHVWFSIPPEDGVAARTL